MKPHNLTTTWADKNFKLRQKIFELKINFISYQFQGSQTRPRALTQPPYNSIYFTRWNENELSHLRSALLTSKTRFSAGFFHA